MRAALGMAVLTFALSACTTVVGGVAIPGGASASGVRGSGLSGSWHAHVRGDYNEYDLAVQLSDSAGQLSGQAIYSNGLSCPATWNQQERSATVIRLIERTTGSPCTPAATIVLTVRDPHHLDYRASTTYTPKNPTGTLVRDGNQ